MAESHHGREYIMGCAGAGAEYLALRFGMNWLAWLAALLLWLAVVEYTRRWAAGRIWIYFVWSGLFIAMGVATYYLIRSPIAVAVTRQNDNVYSSTQPTSQPQSQPPSGTLTSNPKSTPPTKKREHVDSKSRPPIAYAQSPISQECASGANCAQSTGQQGGITAGQVILTQPPARNWEPSEAQTRLLRDAPAAIVIVHINTQEALLFANRIATTLFRFGWKITEFGTCSYNQTFNGVWISGKSSDPTIGVLVGSMEGDIPVRRHDDPEGTVGRVVIHVGDNGPISENDHLPNCMAMMS